MSELTTAKIFGIFGLGLLIALVLMMACQLSYVWLFELRALHRMLYAARREFLIWWLGLKQRERDNFNRRHVRCIEATGKGNVIILRCWVERRRTMKCGIPAQRESP